MTKVTYFEQNNEISISVEGHAGFGEAGSDIVCSAISMLGQALLAYLKVESEKFDYSMRKGSIWAYAKGDNVRTALHVIMTGYKLLEDNYPANIEINRGCGIQTSP